MGSSAASAGAGTAVVAAIAVWLGYQLVTNDNFRWGVVWDYMFHERLLEGCV